MVCALGGNAISNSSTYNIQRDNWKPNSMHMCYSKPMCFMHVLYSEKTGRIRWKVQEYTPGSFANPLADISKVKKSSFPGPSTAHPAVTTKQKSKKKRQHLLCTSPSWTAANTGYKAQLRGEEEQRVSSFTHPAPHKICWHPLRNECHSQQC